MAKTKSQSGCLSPGCNGKNIVGRGLCEKCYFAARRAIKRNELSGWEELERRGYSRPIAVTPIAKAIQRINRDKANKKGAAK